MNKFMVTKKQSIIAMALITAICLAGDSMLYIVLPTQWKVIGLGSIMEVGILLSINRSVRLPLNPMIGYIYSKITIRNAILLAVVLGGVTTFCYGYVHDFRVWIILRSIWGVSWSLLKLGAFLLIIELSNETNRGNYIGTYNGLYRLGSMLGMLVGGFFTDIFGMKIMTSIIGIMAFLTIPFVFLFIPRTFLVRENPQKNLKLKSSLKRFINKDIIGLFTTSFLIVMILDSMLTASLSHLIDLRISTNMELSFLIIGAASIAGSLQAIRWILIFFIAPKIGCIFDKSPYKGYLLAFYLLIASIILMVISMKLPFILWLLLLLIHLVIASILTTTMDIIVSNTTMMLPINKIWFMSAYTIVLDLGAAIGPMLGYTLEEKMGLVPLFLVCSLLFVVLAISWSILTRIRSKSQHQSNISISAN